MTPALFGRRYTIALAGIGRALHANLTSTHVLIRSRDQLFAALALIELDGVAARIVIAPPDVKPEHLPSAVGRAAIDVVVGEDPALSVEGVRFERINLPGEGPAIPPSCRTEWVLFTSGTTGVPKMVAHSLEGLCGAIEPAVSQDIVWGTFYDIRRYGGLQVLLRTLLGQRLVGPVGRGGKHWRFFGAAGPPGVTHLTGTPSHWRRALMSPASAAIAPRYVRLSGEIADQAVLDSLKARFPEAASAMPMPRPKPAWGLRSRMGWKDFPQPSSDELVPSK